MEHSLKTIVMDVITLPDCSMVIVAVAAWTVIITLVMVTLSTSSVDVSQWQRNVNSIRSLIKVIVRTTRYTIIKERQWRTWLRNVGLQCRIPQK